MFLNTKVTYIDISPMWMCVGHISAASRLPTMCYSPIPTFEWSWPSARKVHMHSGNLRRTGTQSRSPQSRNKLRIIWSFRFQTLINGHTTKKRQGKKHSGVLTFKKGRLWSWRVLYFVCQWRQRKKVLARIKQTRSLRRLKAAGL